MPNADATGLAPEKSAYEPSGALILCRRVFAFRLLRHISLVKSRSGGLGYSNAKTARLFLPGAQNPAFCRAATRMPIQATVLPTRLSYRGMQTAEPPTIT